ncbi:MAG: IclR family transcriptional regulator [Microbacterium sp.]
MMTSDDSAGNRSLARGLTILEHVATSRSGITVTELSAACDLDKGTVSRHVTSLERLGYVVRRDDRRIVLTSKLGQLTNGGDNAALRWAARPHLEALCRQVGELVILSVRQGTYVVYIDQVDPEREVRVASQIGRIAPLHDTAMGRSILFTLPESRRAELALALAGEPEEEPGLALTPEEIEAERQRFLRQGFVTVPRNDDLSRVGAPIVAPEGFAVGAVGVYGPAYRMRRRLREIGRATRITADRISEALAVR